MDPKLTEMILLNCRIAWLDSPVLYFEIGELESEGFFREFMEWIEGVSNKKVFEYAHKVSNRAEPEENLLWFTDKSFQSLESWIVNEFEKSLIRNYFNKNSHFDSYTKLQRFKSSLYEDSHGESQEIERFLAMTIKDTKDKNEDDFRHYQEKIKIYEDLYFERVSLLMDFEKDEETEAKVEENLKKKKKQKKKNKEKKIEVCESEIKDENQIEKIEESPVTSSEKEQSTNESYRISQNTPKIIPIITENKNLEDEDLEEKVKTQNESKSDFETNKMNENEIDFKRYEGVSKEKSDNSADWSNAETTKTTKKSGQSHPEFNQFERKPETKNRRHYSPQEHQNSKIKHKIRYQRKNKKYAVSSWNGDSSLCENGQSSLEGNELFCKQELEKCEPENEIKIEKELDEQLNQPQTQKRKKRKNKAITLLSQLSKKVSSTLINKQLNNFIDSLSIETNSLYDHKIISFERVRFFIQSIFPTSSAVLFGSNAVGLSLPTSDIDIMLFNLPCMSRDEAVEILAHLAVQINTMGWIVSCSTYLNAKVPIVKLEIDPTIEYFQTKRKCDYYMNPMIDPRILQHLELPSKQHCQKSQSSLSPIIKVDLTINTSEETFMGGQSTELMKEWMNKYPQIHSCVLAIKYVLVQRGLSSNFKGGIGSYCLFVMVAAFLREYEEVGELDDGEFFVRTLKFYGEEFENQMKSILLPSLPSSGEKTSSFISLEETSNLLRFQMQQTNQQEDPSHIYTIQSNPLRIFDPINNRIISGSCHLFPQIKAEFRRIYKDIEEMKEMVEKEIEMTVTGSEIGKMIENKKAMDKWISKYESRTRLGLKGFLTGSF